MRLRPLEDALVRNILIIERDVDDGTSWNIFTITFSNGLTVRNILSFYNKFFIFYGTLPSDPPNFIKLIY
jgi:hypothetical protein